MNMSSASQRFVSMQLDGANDCRAIDQHKTCIGIHQREID